MVKDQFFQFLLLVPSLSLTDVVMLHFSRMWHSKHPKMTYTMFSDDPMLMFKKALNAYSEFLCLSY